jgi:mono/diheme cytochrome c family protein
MYRRRGGCRPTSPSAATVGRLEASRENESVKKIEVRAAIVTATLPFLLMACSSENAPGGGDPRAQGETVYQNVCIACHNGDPSLPGSLGPAIAGASRELIEARVIHGTYPEGYAAKQTGAVMPQFPHLEGSIDALAAYLGGPAE